MLVLAVNGALHSGKSTVADYLVGNLGFQRFKFAYHLKKMLVDGLGLTWDDLEDPVKKEAPHPLLDGRTPRHAMQTLGDWGRDVISKPLWANRTMQDIKGCANPYGAVIDDMRFQNEADMVTGLGGHTLKVVRPGNAAGSPEARAHKSENQDITTEHIIVNDGSLDDLYDQVHYLVDHIRGDL